jgi:SAM-dependent methyltransferase
MRPTARSSSSGDDQQARRDRGRNVEIFYRLAYQLGFRPWEVMAKIRFTEEAAAKIAREESGRQRPYGRALDLGCGRGLWTIKLAERGWQVTGIDMVEKALSGARKRAAKAGVNARFVAGDVTALRSTGIGNGFQLLLDLGCFHSLSDAQREAMGREVSAIADPDATMVMMSWSPGRVRGPMQPRGATFDQIAAAYPDWTVTDEGPCDVSDAPGLVKKAEPRWYLLRHDRAKTA